MYQLNIYAVCRGSHSLSLMGVLAILRYILEKVKFLLPRHIANFTGYLALLLLAAISGFTDLRAGFNCFLMFGILFFLNLLPGCGGSYTAAVFIPFSKIRSGPVL